ncbi:MAG: 2-isopropylmalate synthase [Eubacteriales bacterium]|nr:2-isopropylmalate synthase [Eubacteriales bacterium]
MEKVKIFDTTLRDGEQTPRVNLNREDKIMIARQLEKLGVDIIEAGFPIASEGDFLGVEAVARTVEKPTVCALARCVKADIERAAEALKDAKHPRIHVFLATSDIHLTYKLKLSREEAVARAREMVAYAKSFVDDIQFSAEDASRTDKDFLCEIFGEVIRAGATTINIPDTVGFIQPAEYADFIAYIRNNTEGMDKVTISVHCHDDLGLGTANALGGVMGGARQVECTVNGLGERAGNSALEEVVMALDTRGKYYNLGTNVKTREIYRTSKLVTSLTGVEAAPTKSVIGMNCFLHESGIHQDGILKNRSTYEIMNPAKIGIPMNDGIVLGKHSGRHAFKAFLQHHGFELSEKKTDKAFREFKKLTDNKKYVTVEDITAIVIDEVPAQDNFRFVSYQSRTDENGETEVTVKLVNDGRELAATAVGNGQVDAAYKAINSIINRPVEITDYEICAVSGKSDALGEAKVRMKLGTREINTSGLDMDVIKASILAYIQGINKLGVTF